MKLPYSMYTAGKRRIFELVAFSSVPLTGEDKTKEIANLAAPSLGSTLLFSSTGFLFYYGLESLNLEKLLPNIFAYFLREFDPGTGSNCLSSRVN